MPDPTVSAGYAKSLMELAVARGASRQLLASKSNIDPVDLLDQDNRIPWLSFVTLMRESKILCNDPALALRFGEASLFTEISVVGLICHSVESMAEAFAQMNRYARLVVEWDGVGNSDRFQLFPCDDGIWMEDTRSNPNDFPELTESTFARFICEMARYFGNAPFAKEIHVTHAEPDYRHEYDRILKSPVVFESDRNAILVHESWLSLKISPTNGFVFGALSKHADALLRDLAGSKTTKGRVESLLVPILHTGEVNMERISKMMGLSRQALYRKLKAEGASYETLLDELRHKMAVHYLSGKKVSVNETAYLVGFSDSSAFSRAFKRWTGRSPRQFTNSTQHLGKIGRRLPIF